MSCTFYFTSSATVFIPRMSNYMHVISYAFKYFTNLMTFMIVVAYKNYCLQSVKVYQSMWIIIKIPFTMTIKWQIKYSWHCKDTAKFPCRTICSLFAKAYRRNKTKKGVNIGDRFQTPSKLHEKINSS